MANTDIHACRTCGKVQAEAVMLEYNDKWFCCLKCRLKQERKDDEGLTIMHLRSRGFDPSERQ